MKNEINVMHYDEFVQMNFSDQAAHVSEITDNIIQQLTDKEIHDKFPALEAKTKLLTILAKHIEEDKIPSHILRVFYTAVRQLTGMPIY